MARIPQTLGTQRRLDTGGPVSYSSSSPLGDAVSSIGRQAMHVADVWQRQQQELDEFKLRRTSQQLDLDLQGSLQEAVQNMPADGEGFHDTFVGQVGPDGTAVRPGLIDQKVQQYRDMLPESVRPQFEAQIPLLRQKYSNEAAKLQYTQRQAYFEMETTKALDDLQIGIMQIAPGDDATAATLRKQGEDLILASGLPAAEKQAKVLNWRAASAEAHWQARAQVDPGGAKAALGVARRTGGDILDRIIQVESGGDPNAANPNSSARGLGQFTAGTWVATVRKHAPELAEGRSRAQLLALRNDADISRRMLAAHTEDNRRQLQQAGVNTTDGALYLAHFAGAGAATQILRAVQNGQGDRSVSAFMSADAIEANSFLKGKTASDLVAWADKKMGGGSVARPGEDAADPAFQDIPYARRIVLAIEADKRLNALQTAAEQSEKEAAALQKAEREAYYQSARLGIQTGEIREPDQILNDPLLSDGHKATLLNTLDTERKAGAQLRADAADFTNGTLNLNPYLETDRTRANKLFSDLIDRIGDDDERKQILTGTFIAQTGVVPAPVAADIQRGLMATQPGDLMNAMQIADSIAQAAPQAFDNMKGAGQVRDELAIYRHLVNERGLSAEEAARELIDRRKPERKQSDTLIKSIADEAVKEIEIGDVISVFDESWFSDPSAGAAPAMQESLLHDYREIYRDKIRAAQGDTEAAKAMADEEIKRLYGVTQFAGDLTVAGAEQDAGDLPVALVPGEAPQRDSFTARPTIMKYPPERHYPAINGSHDYIREALIEDIKSQASGIITGITLVPYQDTAADIRSKRPPRYQVMYQEEINGQKVWQTIIGGAFQVPADTISEKLAAEQEKRRQEFEARQMELQEQKQRIEQLYREGHKQGTITAPEGVQ